MTKLQKVLSSVLTLVWLSLFTQSVNAAVLPDPVVLTKADARHLLTRTGLGVDYRVAICV